MASNYNNDSLENFTPSNAPADPDLLKDVAQEELGETEELKEECLKKLRTLIKDNNVMCIDRDDFLLRFLRVKKFDVQRSFETLRSYAKQQGAFQNYIENLQPDTVKAVLQHNILSILPYRDAKGRLVHFKKLGAWDSSICSAEDVIMTMLLVSYYTAERQSSQITGIIYVHYETMPLRLILYMVRRARFIATLYFNALPQRYSAVHLVNESAVVKMLFQIINPILPQKIKERIHFHGKSREVLFQNLPPNILPEEIDGNLGPVNNDHFIEEMVMFLEKMKDERRFFLEHNN